MKKFLPCSVAIFSLISSVSICNAEYKLHELTVCCQKMCAHVYENNQKENQKTIVLLSGWGTENPNNDFKCLIDELQKNFKVVVLDYFGYGNSDETDRERSNKDIVDEINEALERLGINKCILMPHSMSGLYALYLASKFPEKVEAIVGIDMSLPQKQIERWSNNFPLWKYPNDKKVNKTMVNQWNWFLKNSKELEKTQYPENLPVLAFIASEQIENVNSMIESGEMKTSWEDINKNMITNDEIQKIIPLEGTHYLHHTQSATISEKLKDFFFENIELDFSKYFKNKNGCALFFDNEKYYTNNSTLVNIEKSPCSTFKIVITLAGLKYRILQDENTVIKWDGKKRYFDEWNKDLNLKEAFNSSAVWYFQEVANKIGRKRLDEFIKSISYGNCDTSGEFPFWLDSSLKISPKQQVEFLRALFEHNLSVDETHISILKKIMSKGNLNGGNLYGKTGTSGEGNNGWFVGFYEKENKKLYFAVNLSEGENVSGKQAESIAKNIIIDCF